MAAFRITRKTNTDRAVLLARRLSEALARERIVPRFVDSYVIEHGRYGLQVHASLYKDLLNLLHREALLAMCSHALDLMSKGSQATEGQRFKPLTRKESAAFRQKFLVGLTRQQNWNLTASLEFQSDLRRYEEILSRARPPRRSRKPFETANHPFVDRCAFLLDSSFLEKARLAASRVLSELETVATRLTLEIFR